VSEYLGYDEFCDFVTKYRRLELVEFKRRAGFTVEEVEAYEQCFQEFDTDGGGDLSLKELMPLLEQLGRAPKTVIQRDKLTTLLAEVDGDKSGLLDFEEFLQLMRKFIAESDAEQLAKEKEVIKRTDFGTDEVSQWRAMFEQFDSDGNMEFDIDEATKLLRVAGIPMDASLINEFQKIFHRVDEDRNGTVDFPEFLLLIRALVDVNFAGIRDRMPGKRK